MLAPVAKAGCGAGIYIISRIVIRFVATEDDADEVIRAGGVVEFLQGRSDLVVRLGDCQSWGGPLGIVTKRAEGLNVSHGTL